MEIERKYLVNSLPEGYEAFPSHAIEQAYLCTDPVVRVRKEDDAYYLTYKSRGLLAREEYNLSLNEKAYRHLLAKADGTVLTKRRYRIPLEPAGVAGTPAPNQPAGTSAPNQPAGTSAPLPAATVPLTAELDIFSGRYEGLMLVEVEFPTVEMAEQFAAPGWFGEDVTFSGEYQNSRLSRED